jgi:arylsulfatase A-like enzyme
MAGLLGAELVLVAATNWREFVGNYELTLARTSLLPVACAAVAPLALVGAAVLEVVARAARPGARALAASGAALFGAVVAFGVSTGRHLEGARRPPFVVAVALAGAALAWVIAPRIARAIAPRPGLAFRLGLVGAVVLTEIALAAVNLRVLPRLYPAFHLGLGALALLVAPFVAPALDAADAPSRPRGGVLGALATPKLLRAALALCVFAGSAAVAQAGAARLSRADNVRIIYLTHGPLLAHAVELAARLAPPLPIDDAQAAPAPSAIARSVDLRGRDLLLVTVDALRADHVGALGYKRPTTPSLDRLAQGGVLFEAAYTPTPHTSYAVTSIMTGKYMRPLLLQGLGGDSETWAAHLRRYGYRTAAFYPPAVFFIDGERFTSFRDRSLDFEYRKIEFASAAQRVDQVKAYLGRVKPEQRLFLWVHLFEPHEPYEAHAEHPFGDRDVDRYDAEIAAADAGLGAIVDVVRGQRPSTVVLVAADHGEEFGEHGGRYHGTSVHEEQVRVPLVVNAPGLLPPHRVAVPVQLVDLLPTVLSGLDIPRPARVRGTDLGPALAQAAPSGEGSKGFAFAETDSQTLLAKGGDRLVCERRVGACALYAVGADPAEERDTAPSRPADVAALRAELRGVEASHGRYELQGLRSEGKGWPEALRRGIAGDADAALDVAALLDDADAVIRRRAAEVLFELRRSEAAPALRLAVVRDDDEDVRRWSALALTRLGEGAAKARDLVQDKELVWRRLAALSLAEQGDDRGELTLVGWLREAVPGGGEGKGAPSRPTVAFERAREIVLAIGKIKAKSALPSLIDALDDVRLRPFAATALASIGEDAARPSLAKHLENERYQTARVAIAEALVKLGAGPELRTPLVRLLGTPDPLPDGLRVALDASLLDLVGGPRVRELDRLRRFARSGVAVGMTVPKGGNGTGVRALCRARATDGRPGEVRLGRAVPRDRGPAKIDRASAVPAEAPELDAASALVLEVPAGAVARDVFGTLPAGTGPRPGEHGELVVYATQNVEVAACALVPLADEIPPPPPEPWTPTAEEDPSP